MTSPTTDRRRGLNSSAAIKVPVAAATTAAITLSGAQTIDGVAIVADDRVLVKNQADAATNGIYIADTGAWSRDIDFDNNWDLMTSTFVAVEPGGTTLGSTWWYVSTTGTITVGTSDIDFSQVNMLSYTEPSQQTIVSAATGADIWTAEGIVNWTGTATCTDFADASAAGQRRTLFCTAASSFTASASMLIRNVPSGGTITMAAYDLVHVYAVSTTVFQLDFDKADALPVVASHALTADIWSKGEVISWTGTETTTDFVDAPQAGMRRTLICTQASKFTTGTPITIRGLATASTVTMKANAIVYVTSLTTSTFLLEYSLDGSFIATATSPGFDGAVTATWYYSVTNGVVTIDAKAAAFTGTSDSTDFKIGTFPAEIRPAGNRIFPNLVGQDATAWVYTVNGVLDVNGILTLVKDAANAPFTNSGTKLLYSKRFTYILGA